MCVGAAATRVAGRRGVRGHTRCGQAGATLLELHATGHTAGPGSRATAAAGRIGGSAATAARWPRRMAATFGAALLRHRRRYYLIALELGVSASELLAFQYGVPTSKIGLRIGWSKAAAATPLLCIRTPTRLTLVPYQVKPLF